MELNEFIVIAIAIGLGFYVQTIVGFASSLISIPILLYIMTIQEAVGMTSIFFVLFSAILYIKNWKDMHKRTIVQLGIGMLFGVTAGIALLKYGSPMFLKRALGVFIIIFVVSSFWGNIKWGFASKNSIIFGFVGGIFSGLFSTGGSVYIINIFNKFDKGVIIRATVIGILGVGNVIKIPLLMISGILTYAVFIKAVYLLPVFLFALFLGDRTYHMLNEELFKKILIVILVCAGLALIIS